MSSEPGPAVTVRWTFASLKNGHKSSNLKHESDSEPRVTVRVMVNRFVGGDPGPGPNPGPRLPVGHPDPPGPQLETTGGRGPSRAEPLSPPAPPRSGAPVATPGPSESASESDSEYHWQHHRASVTRLCRRLGPQLRSGSGPTGKPPPKHVVKELEIRRLDQATIREWADRGKGILGSGAQLPVDESHLHTHTYTNTRTYTHTCTHKKNG